MKNSIVHALTLLVLGFSTSAFADKIKITTPAGWIPIAIEKGDTLAIFYPGSAAVIVRHKTEKENPDDPSTTVRVREYKVENIDSLKGDKKAWQEAIYSTSQRAKMSFGNQEPTKVNGQWRYVVQAQVDVDTKTMLNIAMLATVVDGKLYVLRFEHQDPAYKKEAPSVFELFKKLDIEVTK